MRYRILRWSLIKYPWQSSPAYGAVERSRSQKYGSGCAASGTNYNASHRDDDNTGRAAPLFSFLRVGPLIPVEDYSLGLQAGAPCQLKTGKGLGDRKMIRSWGR